MPVLVSGDWPVRGWGGVPVPVPVENVSSHWAVWSGLANVLPPRPQAPNHGRNVGIHPCTVEERGEAGL